VPASNDAIRCAIVSPEYGTFEARIGEKRKQKRVVRAKGAALTRFEYILMGEFRQGAGGSSVSSFFRGKYAANYINSRVVKDPYIFLSGLLAPCIEGRYGGRSVGIQRLLLKRSR